MKALQGIRVGCVVDVAHPLGGSVRMPGKPIKLSDAHEPSATPPPPWARTPMRRQVLVWARHTP